MKTETTETPQLTHDDLLSRIACAVATAEGWFVKGSRPHRNNNPGNLTASFLTRPKDPVFVKFRSPEEGIAALYHQIAKDVTRGLTLRQFVTKYAPPSENDTARYVRETARRTGLDPDTPLWEFLHMERIK